MTAKVRKQKSGDQLAVGDWLAPNELTDGAAEVLHVLAYRSDRVHLVLREQGKVVPYSDVVGSNTLFALASDEDLAELRDKADRAERIADIRALADFLEANPDVPLAVYPSEQVDLHDGEASVALVYELGARFNARVRDDLNDRTQVYLEFGSFEYRVIAWHKDGRPAEPDADPSGLAYEREADDPTPVSPARVPLHTGAMTDEGLVYEAAF